MSLELCGLSQLSATHELTYLRVNIYLLGRYVGLDVSKSVLCVSTVVEPIFKSRQTCKLLEKRPTKEMNNVSSMKAGTLWCKKNFNRHNNAHYLNYRSRIQSFILKLEFDQSYAIITSYFFKYRSY